MMVQPKVTARTENFRVHDNACFRTLLSRVGCATLIDEFPYRTIAKSLCYQERTKHLSGFIASRDSGSAISIASFYRPPASPHARCHPIVIAGFLGVFQSRA